MNKAHYCAALAQLARRVCVCINLCVFGALGVTSAPINGAIARLTASRGRPIKLSNTEFEIYFLLERGFKSRLMAARAPPHTANDA